MLLQYKNEITILYRCGCCNAYFETKRSGRNDGQNKLDKERKTDLRKFHHVYSHRGVPMFLLNLLKRTLASLIESREEWISSTGISCMLVWQ